MNTWKYGKPYAMVVCSIYQLPSRNSQIYQQASTVNVFISTYSRIAFFINYAKARSTEKAIELLYELFRAVEASNHSKEAVSYWQSINRLMLNFDTIIPNLWKEEKLVAEESIEIAKKEALNFLAMERQRIVSLSKEEALKELLQLSKVTSKEKIIKNVSNTIVDSSYE